MLGRKAGGTGAIARFLTRRGVVGKLTNQHEDEKDVSGIEGAPSNIEGKSHLTAVLTADGKDRKAARRLQKEQAKVVRAEAGYRTTVEEHDRVHAAGPSAERKSRADEVLRRQERVLNEDIDRAKPLITPVGLLFVEIIFVVAEVAFWDQAFSGSVPRGTPWTSWVRLSPLLLAFVIPMVGVFAAHSVGSVWQRVLRHPAKDQRERRVQWAGAAAGLVLLGFACGAVYALVSWRFHAHQLGAKQMPATALAIVFVGLLVVVAFARTFCSSEQAKVNAERDARVEADRRLVAAVENATIQALAGWHSDWLALRTSVAMVLDQLSQVTATSEGIILHSRSRRTDRPGAAPEVTGGLGCETIGGRDGQTVTSYDIPVVGMPWHFDIIDVPATLQALRGAVDTLRRHVPVDLLASRDEIVRNEIAALETRLSDLQARLGADVADDGVDNDDSEAVGGMIDLRDEAAEEHDVREDIPAARPAPDRPGTGATSSGQPDAEASAEAIGDDDGVLRLRRTGTGD
jgi:hypothetical protein